MDGAARLALAAAPSSSPSPSIRRGDADGCTAMRRRVNVGVGIVVSGLVSGSVSPRVFAKRLINPWCVGVSAPKHMGYAP